MIQEQARRKANHAIKRGILLRPHNCQRCGTPNRPCRDGRSFLHAHHHDYSKPLDVEWLCAKCHRKETPLPPPRPIRPEVRGPGNGNAKLTNEQAKEIRAASGSLSSIARVYGVHLGTIWRIKQGKSYIAAAKETKHEQ